MRTEKLIETLYECATYCEHCADACLNGHDKEKMIDCIRLDKICAAACSATAKSLVSQSNDADALVEVCQEISEKCGEECEKYEAEHCRKCAEVCKRCAEECSRYAA